MAILTARVTSPLCWTEHPIAFELECDSCIHSCIKIMCEIAHYYKAQHRQQLQPNSSFVLHETHTFLAA